MRPSFERGRAEPPVPITDDLDDSVAPPLPGKLHAIEEMDDATPTLDDEHRNYHHHPNDAGSVEFGFHPEAADAAADLAGDLGFELPRRRDPRRGFSARSRPRWTIAATTSCR
ncbi:MAG: hypothetical protein QM820_41385 [Minicystis sp.]